MKSLALVTAMMAAVLLPILTTACAHAPAHKTASACNPQPQWITNDAQGRPSNAVFVCFAQDGSLLWSARPLTAQEIAAMTAQAAAAKPKAHK